MLLVFYKNYTNATLFYGKNNLIELCDKYPNEFIIDNINQSSKGYYSYKYANIFFKSVHKINNYNYIRRQDLKLPLAELNKDIAQKVYQNSILNLEDKDYYYSKLYFDGNTDWNLITMLNNYIDNNILPLPNCKTIIKNKCYITQYANAKIVNKLLALLESDIRFSSLKVLFYDFTLDILNNDLNNLNKLEIKNNNSNNSSFISSSDTEIIKENINFNKSLMNFPPVEGKHPYENYQEEDIIKGLSQNRYAFFLGMGTGKSYITSAILANLFENNKIQKAIIVTTNVGVYNLKEQILKLCNYFKKDEIEIIKSKNKSLFLENEDYKNTKIFIFAYSTALSLYKLYKKEDKLIGFCINTKNNKNNEDKKENKDNKNIKICLCLDECHKIGSENSQVSKAILNLAKLCDYRYLFTGTPGDKPDKFYNLFKILDFSGLLHKATYTNFVKEYVKFRFNPFLRSIPKGDFTSNQIMSYGWKPSFQNLKKKMENNLVVYRNTKDVLNLPEMLEKRIQFSMDDTLENLYFSYVEELISNSDSLFYNDSLTQIQKFSVMSNILDDPLLAYNAINKETGEYRYSQNLRDGCLSYSQKIFLKSPKIQFIKELLEDLDENQKIIIWVTHPITAKTLQNYFNEYFPLVVTGETNEKDRQEIYEEFNTISSKHKVLIASSYVVNSSIDLFVGGCNIQVYLQREWSALSEEQTQARIYRLGQTKPVYTYFLLYKNSLDVSRDYIIKNKLNINHSLETRLSVKDFFMEINSLGNEKEKIQ